MTGVQTCALPISYGGRLPYHVRVLWDEAANTGPVPGLEKIVAVIRSREISLTLFYQAMSQCKEIGRASCRERV